MYHPASIEPKWQKFWANNATFVALNPPFSGVAPKKAYILDMFPYPSGAGLHVGHPKGYTATDVYSRFLAANGYNVLHPMGWDAFGLPAENYAVKTGQHPRKTTEENVSVFKRQIQELGMSYDWSREINTTDPEYYRWSQWIFSRLVEQGLAYEADMPVNWCPALKCVLANEEIVNGKSEVGGHPVERRNMRQWVLRITEYAERLLADIDTVDWPEGIKEQQRNWIGKSEGCEFRLLKKIENKPVAIILHGWADENAEMLWHWQSGLKADLESAGYEVIMPILPGASAPDLETQLECIAQYRSKIDERSIIVGHSMWGFLAMHFVAWLGKKIGQLICVAPVFNGLGGQVDWSSWMSAGAWSVGSKSMSHEYSADLIRANTHSWKVFLSKDDECIIYPQAVAHFESIGVEHIDIADAGHFCTGDGYAVFPELTKLCIPGVSVYTTRVDTVYGMKWVVIAPDHPQVSSFVTEKQKGVCEAYIIAARSKSDQDRTNDSRKKTGEFTGSYVINPFNGESVQVWIADYVLGSYGTGAVMGVPAHDERDFEFAVNNEGLEVTQVVTLGAPGSLTGSYIITYDLAIESKIPDNEKDGVTFTPSETCYSSIKWAIIIWARTETLLFLREKYSISEAIKIVTEYWNVENTDMLSQNAITFFTEKAEREGFGRKRTNYKLRDWIFSRQRYWGEPIPVIHLNTEDYANVRLEPAVTSRIIGAAVLLINQEGKLILQRRTIDAPTNPGKIAFFGGAREWDEKLEHTCVRELREEIELTIQAHELQFVGDFASHTNPGCAMRIFSLWDIEIDSTLLHLHEGDAIEYLTLNEALESPELTDFTREALLRWNSTEGWLHCRGMDDREFLFDGSKYISEIFPGLDGPYILDKTLPLRLPEVAKYEPSDDGRSPLANVTDWVNTEIAPGLRGTRETNTMPQWAGSCWYYLRFMDPHNPDAIASKEAMEYWGSVDHYVGGAEHAVLHLLYARFWHKVLYDIGVVPTSEPFQKLTNQGLILGPDGNKMSKSKGNVINPDDIVKEFGADTLRAYILSMADFKDPAPWDTRAMVGMQRFLERSEALFGDRPRLSSDEMRSMKLLHKTIKKVGEDIAAFKFNTAISALIILVNEGLPTDSEFQLEWRTAFALMLHPFAPHLGEELWSKLGHTESIYRAPWPEFDSFMTIDDEVTIAIQVNGKLRGTKEFLNGVAAEEVISEAYSMPEIAKWVEGKKIIREIFVPNKLLNIVVGE